jgi:hypothetical protein
MNQPGMLLLGHALRAAVGTACEGKSHDCKGHPATFSSWYRGDAGRRSFDLLQRG